MALDIDGRATLTAICQAPQAFPGLDEELSRLARTLLEKQLKQRGLTLPQLQQMFTAVGEPAMAQVIEGLSEAALGSLLGKLDKHGADYKQTAALALRQHLLGLSSGRLLPTPAVKKPVRSKAATPDAPAKAAKPATPKKTVKRALSSKAMAASWDGKVRGDAD